MSIQTYENGGFYTMKKKMAVAVLCTMLGASVLAGCGETETSTNTVKEEAPTETEAPADPTDTPVPQPTDTPIPEETETPAEAAAPVETEAPTNDTAAADSAGIRPEVKDFLDSYETFMNNYCDFMEKYENSDDVVSMMNDYTEYMKQYADFTQKMDDMGDSDLNTEELKYYLDVQNRVSQRLLTVSGS